MKKNLFVREKTAEVETIIFDSVQDLYQDLLSNQSFIISRDEYADGKAIIESNTIYRHIALHKGHLHFHGNKFGGSELHITSNILHSKKTSSSTAISEYTFTIDGLTEPFILMACKKSQRQIGS